MAASEPRGPGYGHVAMDAVERGGLPILLVLLVVLFSTLPSTRDIFTSGANIRHILATQVVTGVIALAMVIPLSAGFFDLSIASSTGLANFVVMTVVAKHDGPIALGFLAGIAVGAAIGLVNAFLVATLNLDALVITLGTYTLLGGLQQWLSKGETILANVPTEFFDWTTQRITGIPLMFIMLMVISVAVWYLLRWTPFGRQLESIGSNIAAARLVGVPVKRTIFLGFVSSGIMAGIAGILLSITTGSADPNSGNGYLFPALAAVFIGTTAIRPGYYNVWGCVLGVYFAAVAVSGLTLMGARTWVTPVFNGSALVVAIAIARFMARSRDRRARAARIRLTGNVSAGGEPAGSEARHELAQAAADR